MLENSQTKNPAKNVEKKNEPYNNETIMLSECATLLRDIRFGIRFFGEKGRRFFFYS